MSRHFILDGYNVLHSTSLWADLSREKQRIQFLKYLDETRPTGSSRNSVTVVLDGYAASLKNIHLNLVRIVFSGDRDADTVIKEMVSALRSPGSAVVVTNDRGIRMAVRRTGAQVMSCEDFFLLQKKKVVPNPSDTMSSKDLDSINSELKRLWKLD